MHRPLRSARAARFVAVLTLATAWDVGAATITVDHFLDDEVTDGACSIREALVAAASDAPTDGCVAGSGADVVQLPAGTIVVASYLSLPANVTLAGAGREQTTLDAAFQTRVLVRSGLAAAEVRDLTLTRGRGVPGQFGGCFSQGYQQATTFRRVAMIDCAASGVADGGAIASDGSLTVIESRFIDNVAARNGGAIQVRQDVYDPEATNRIERSYFENNHAGAEGSGGAIMSSAAELVVSESTFRANGAWGGGAIVAGQITIERSTFESNVASYAGGAAWVGGSEIVNSTFSANHAATGGAVFFDGPSALRASTFVGNTRVQDLLPVGNSLHNRASLSIGHTALAVAAGTNCTGNPPASLGSNLATDASCALGEPGDVEGMDPALGPLADNGGPTPTHLPAPTSPLVDAAAGVSCEPFDQRGVSRPRDGDADGQPACDIGAVELLPEPESAALAATALLALAARSTRRRH